MRHILAWKMRQYKYQQRNDIVCMWNGTRFCFHIKTIFPGLWTPIKKIRRPWYHIICIMRIPLLVTRYLYIETGPSMRNVSRKTKLVSCPSPHFRQVTIMHYNGLHIRRKKTEPMTVYFWHLIIMYYHQERQLHTEPHAIDLVCWY